MGTAFTPEALVALQRSSFCLQHVQKLNPPPKKRIWL